MRKAFSVVKSDCRHWQRTAKVTAAINCGSKTVIVEAVFSRRLPTSLSQVCHGVFSRQLIHNVSSSVVSIVNVSQLYSAAAPCWSPVNRPTLRVKQTVRLAQAAHKHVVFYFHS